MTRASEALLLLLVGAVLGPDGIQLLSTEVLSFIDPVLPVALVALGALVGLGSSAEGRREKRLLAAATTDAAVTVALVTGGMLLVAPSWGGTSSVPSWFVAVMLGVCAAPSAATAGSPPRLRGGVPAALRRTGGEQVIADRVGDLDALLPIVLGGIALAWLRAPSAADALLLALQACGIALVIAAAAWLLISRSSSETEQRVFTAALLLLLGGAADYLSLSALLSGLVAGLFVEWVGGPARDAIGRDVLQFQRPLLALVLLVTGARVDLPPSWIGFGVTFLLIRTAAKLVGGWAATRVAGPAAPRDLGIALLSPGILGIAFALNALRAAGPDGALVLSVATVGTIGSELLAALVRPREAAE
ncbi:MAG: hypothetical protein HYY76_20380 [Acidobacteria bacterium]|nr:hypothetical protein [Acidobacteriota bacterium]